MTVANAKPDQLIRGPLGTTTVNAASSAWWDVSTVEAKISEAIAYAVSIGAKAVYVPDCFLPYTASQVTFNSAVQMIREGGTSVEQGLDVVAYGAAVNGVLSGNTVTGTDDTAAWNAVAAAVNATTMGARIVMPSGLSLFGTGLTFTKRVTIVGVQNASVLVFTGTGTALTWNYPSTQSGLDGVGWAPGIQHAQLWRQGLDLTQVGIVIGGTNGASGFQAFNGRSLGFATALRIGSNTNFGSFIRWNFDACTKQIETIAGSTGGGENFGFYHCVIANGQNAAAGVDWKVTGFNGEFLNCSFDAVPIALSAGTMHCTNCHFENLGTNGLNSHIMVSGGSLDIVGGECYITSASFTPAAPIVITGGTVNVFGLTGNSIPAAVSGMYSVTSPGKLLEMGTRDLTNFSNLVAATSTGTIVTGPNVVQAQAAPRAVTGTIAGAGTFTPDLSAGRRFEVTCSGSTGTVANPTNVIQGSLFTVEIINTFGNALAVTWGANYTFAGPWVDPGFNSRHRITFEINSVGNPVEVGRGLTRLTKEVALVSGTTPALDASLGNYFTLTILTNIAVVIAVPSNPPPNALATQTMVVAIRNGSGGALTTPPTFNTGALGFKFTAGQIVNPANGTQVLYVWQWDAVQAFWYLIGVSPGGAN